MKNLTQIEAEFEKEYNEKFKKRIENNQCVICGKPLEPLYVEDFWDKQSYFHSCGCVDKNIITVNLNKKS
jgi:hypothetical protein